MEAEAILDCKFRKEVFNGVRLLIFRHVFQFDGTKSTESPNSFNIITRDHELELTWTIERSYIIDSSRRNSYTLTWNKIKLQKCDKNIHGNFFIYSSKNIFNRVRFFINVNSLPYIEKLSGLQCKSNDTLTVSFAIYVENQQVSTLLENYHGLLQTKKYSDITFLVGNEEISAHKLIVASRSDVFAAMFDSDMMEKKTGRIEITDIEPTIFKQLSSFMYSGNVDSMNTDELLKLIQAADKYSVRSLVNMCAYRLSCDLSIANAVDILIVAASVNSDFLKKNCIDLIIKNKQKIVTSESYDKLRQFHPDVALEIFDSMMGKKKTASASSDHSFSNALKKPRLT